GDADHHRRQHFRADHDDRREGRRHDPRPPAAGESAVMNMTAMVLPAGISGWVDPAFARVAEVFAASLASGEEAGATVTVLSGGRAVVEIHGGQADTAIGRPWSSDTLACCFSV